MAALKSTVFITGKLFWAKVLGKPRPNYGGDANEWTFEIEPDKKGLEVLKNHKLTDRLKDKHEGRGKYLVLRKSELSKDGRENAPIRVYDKEQNEWDGNKLIGNGSVADVKLDIRDYGPGKKKGVYPVAIRITEPVAYQSSEFGAMDGEDTSSVKTDDFAKDFGLAADPLDDEILL